MYICGLCRKEFVVDKHVTRRSVCPKCGADLHICLNCRFYDETRHNKCAEPKADFQRSRDKANFCDFFVYLDKPMRGTTTGEKDSAKKAFEDLFRK